MIRVIRPPAPSAIYGPDGPAAKEEKRNHQRIDKKKKPSFSVYKRTEIKIALNAIFHGKCAYCESRYAATQPMDVEHWRPKSEVHEADGSVLVNQYFFLAADWENLMPSCIDCNRIRTHEVIFPDLSRRPLNLGKGNRFPIAGKRATDRLSLVSEDPLLLSPFTDDPTQHLEFIREGVVRAKSGTKSLKSEHSIEVYALNRVGLVNERYERILLIQKYIHTIRRLARALEKDTPPSVAEILRDLISYEMTALRALRDERQPYALLSRQLTNEFFASGDGMPTNLR